ncbi:hypothetical protein PMIT1303_01232 [Prochlorococcus sp. MIT 1303]|nr:hypothetical protein PMIT1303_01232 [Prochlorococcus sp. MIT 1303]
MRSPPPSAKGVYPVALVFRSRLSQVFKPIKGLGLGYGTQAGGAKDQSGSEQEPRTGSTNESRMIEKNQMTQLPGL